MNINIPAASQRKDYPKSQSDFIYSLFFSYSPEISITPLPDNHQWSK